jgi:hypothetical protein
MQIAQYQQAKSLRLRSAASLARLRRDQGRRAAAGDLLARACGGFTEDFDTTDLKEAKLLSTNWLEAGNYRLSPVRPYEIGLRFWFRQKKSVGSYLALSATSRA